MTESSHCFPWPPKWPPPACVWPVLSAWPLGWRAGQFPGHLLQPPTSHGLGRSSTSGHRAMCLSSPAWAFLQGRGCVAVELGLLSCSWWGGVLETQLPPRPALDLLLGSWGGPAPLTAAGRAVSQLQQPGREQTPLPAVAEAATHVWSWRPFLEQSLWLAALSWCPRAVVVGGRGDVGPPLLPVDWNYPTTSFP